MNEPRREPDTAKLLREALARDAAARAQADREAWSRRLFGQGRRRSDPGFEMFNRALNPPEKDD